MGSFVEEMESELLKRIKQLHFFDCNCWIGRSMNLSPECMRKVEDLISYMDYCGIERAIVCHHLSRYYHPLIGNEELLKEIKEHERLEGCFVLIPPVTDEMSDIKAYVNSMVQRGVRSVRMFPKTHTYSMEEWSSSILFGLLEDHELPLFIWHRETDWESIYRICKNHPQLPVILEQCDDETFWEGRHIFPLMNKCQNLYLSTHNCILYKELDKFVSEFGDRRIIFGTYFPIDDPHASLMLVTYGNFSDSSKEYIAYKNLDNLLSKVKI